MSNDAAAKNARGSENAKVILKCELARRGISYQNLAELLNRQGWNLNKAAVDNRMSRGAFSADFFLDSLRVIGCHSIDIIACEPASDEK